MNTFLAFYVLYELSRINLLVIIALILQRGLMFQLQFCRLLQVQFQKDR